MNRKILIKRLGERIYQQNRSHPLKVAIDGIDAAGKTTLADELARYLSQYDREVIRVSEDNFHNPASVRKAQGDLSPQGFYQDSFNDETLIQYVLEPLSPDGNKLYRTSGFNLKMDESSPSSVKRAMVDAILLVDGIFLLRPALIRYWDLSIYLDISCENSIIRGTLRDTNLLEPSTKTERRYRRRYIPGQKLYLSEAHPLDRADIIIDNNVIEDPEFIKFPSDF